MKMDEHIEKKIKNAKFMMKYTKPLLGYLGNQYLYWENEYRKLKKINQSLK